MTLGLRFHSSSTFNARPGRATVISSGCFSTTISLNSLSIEPSMIHVMITSLPLGTEHSLPVTTPFAETVALVSELDLQLTVFGTAPIGMVSYPSVIVSPSST